MCVVLKLILIFSKYLFFEPCDDEKFIWFMLRQAVKTIPGNFEKKALCIFTELLSRFKIWDKIVLKQYWLTLNLKFGKF